MNSQLNSAWCTTLFQYMQTLRWQLWNDMYCLNNVNSESEGAYASLILQTIPHIETITSQISFHSVWLIWAEFWLSETKKSWLQYYITPALVRMLLCMFDTNKGAINTLMSWQLNELTHMDSSIKISSFFLKHTVRFCIKACINLHDQERDHENRKYRPCELILIP